MDELMRYLFTGLSFGALYALVALGVVVIYRGTGHVNFAQGEMATLSAFMVWFFNDLGVPFVVAVLLGMAFGFALGAVTEMVIIRPLDRKSTLTVFVGIAGLFLAIHAFTGAVWGALPPEQIGSLFPDQPDDFVRIGGAVWRYEYIGILAVALALTALLFVLFQRTRFGLAMRAVATNPDSARLVGIRTGTVLAVSWGIAGVLGAIAATLYAGVQGQVTPSLMFTVFVYGVAAATVGGLDSPGGAVIAGLSLGVIENLAAGLFPEWIGEEMRVGVALVALVVVLLVKPAGLFGTVRMERV